MKVKWPAVVIASAVTSAVLALPAAAQQDTTSKDLQMYKQRTEALEKKVEMLERATREATEPTEEAIQRVAKKMAASSEKPTDMLVSWKDGLNFQTRDGKIKMAIGGRLDLDGGWLDEDEDVREYAYPMDPSKTIGDQKDAVEARRLRLSVSGSLYDDAFFKLETDFAGSEKVVQKTGGSEEKLKTSTVVLKDAYFGIKNLVPYATLQAGHFKEPFSLEELTSDNYVTFMERALPNAFAPSYNMGVQLSNAVLEERMTWAAGAFVDTDDTGYGVTEGNYNLTARVTGLPWYEADGVHFLHVGLDGSYRNRDAGTQSVQYKARPENHLASYFVDTNKITADYALQGDAEAALVYGPFSLQSELMDVSVDRVDETNSSFWGGYVQASYFLTGESRGYKKSAGCFDRVHPNQSLGQTKDGVKGMGAWEVAARYSWIDLNDGEVEGGRLGDATLGLNWYLNPNMRIQANYVLADLQDTGDSEGGMANLFGLRFHIDF